MQILVLGGSYFIGWHLVQKLAEKDQEIFVLNRGTKSRDYPKNVTLLKADRNMPGELSNVLKGKTFDVVYDISAYNKEQTQKLLDSLDTSNLKHYIQISTAAVYYPIDELPLAEESPIGKHPVWGEYGMSKFGCDELLLDKYESKDLPITIVRPSYVYGPDNYLQREQLIFEKILKGETIEIPGKGDALLQFGYVDDLADALVSIIGCNEAVGEILNVSGDEKISIVDYVEMIGSLAGKKPNIKHIDTGVQGLKDRDIFPFDNITYYTDNTKAKKILNWQPKYTLKEGLNYLLKESKK